MNRIRELRQAKGWTQVELSRRSGVVQSVISDVECGKRNAGVYTMLKIAKTLEVTLDEILTDEVMSR